MIQRIDAARFLAQKRMHPVVDVRSPGEFRQGHLPGAHNIPLFTDGERAMVGSLYVKSGREDAIRKGMEIAVPKVPGFLVALRGISLPGDLYVHCWRGGMRSEQMAGVFSDAGYRVFLVEGGYKACRHEIRKELGRPARVLVLGGCTGSGKTGLLHAMRDLGEQVIDLEGLASHRGSAFGALGLPGQPSNEQFENDLSDQWSSLDFSRTLWMEDESRMIGRVTLPDPVVEQISSHPMIRVEMPLSRRIDRLVSEYAGYDAELLAASLKKIGDRLGGQRTKEALQALEEGRFAEMTAIVLAYYDKAYNFSIARRKCNRVTSIAIEGTDMHRDAEKIIETGRKITY